MRPRAGSAGDLGEVGKVAALGDVKAEGIGDGVDA
jgi:hypothetical protein